jgi:UDP-N-acetyl-D-mannosaminuronic acid dehydrogenase
LGTGYVGLPLAITLAKAGYKVIGVDTKKEVIEALNSGFLPTKEKDIAKIFGEEKVKQNFTAREKPCGADVFIVSVPTPLESRRKIADLSCVISAVTSILPFLKNGNLIIIESTIPPLTCREVIIPLIEKNTRLKVGTDVYLAHCPERILPGNTFHELVHNNRVIGSIDSKSACMAKEIYSSFVKGQIDIVDDVTAETVKLMENIYRDVNIALANEFSLVAETLGIDGKASIALANKHPRVKILDPSIGVGGHCLPKDPWLLIQADLKNTNLIFAARSVNESMPGRVASKIRKALRDVENPRIVALGMTYKPDSDDLRESPALEVVKILKEEGYEIAEYDNLVKGHEYKSIREIAKAADCVVVLVEHTEIREELEKCSKEIKAVMKTPIILRIGTSYKPDVYDLSQRGRTA